MNKRDKKGRFIKGQFKPRYAFPKGNKLRLGKKHTNETKDKIRRANTKEGKFKMPSGYIYILSPRHPRAIEILKKYVKK